MLSIFWKIWKWPVLLGLLSLAGLISALLADGVGNWVSWLTLASPLITILWFLLKQFK